MNSIQNFLLEQSSLDSNCLSLNTYEATFSSEVHEIPDGLTIKYRINTNGLSLKKYSTPKKLAEIRENAMDHGFDIPIQFSEKKVTRFFNFFEKKQQIWQSERECLNYQGTLPLVNTIKEAEEILEVRKYPTTFFRALSLNSTTTFYNINVIVRLHTVLPCICTPKMMKKRPNCRPMIRKL